MISTVPALILNGREIKEILIQADVSKRGFPHCRIVGMPHKSVAEARERLRSAIVNSGLPFPRCRTTINLSPADLPKHGGQLDVAIAVSLMAAQAVVAQKKLGGALFIGELALDGSILPVKGLRAMLSYAQNNNFIEIFVPSSQESECSQERCIPVEKLSDLILHLQGRQLLQKAASEHSVPLDVADSSHVDFSHIVGQEEAKRALEIAAVGAHHVCMVGSPGIGKTLLAQALHGILPRPTYQEYDDMRLISSYQSILSPPDIQRPFVQPHISCTLADLIGGKKNAMIGDFLKASNGILFMDELPEFRRECIQSLKSLLDGAEDSAISLQLIAAMNPCACGNYGHPLRKCVCSIQSVNKYQQKISDAIHDRIDIHIHMQDVTYSSQASYEKSQQVRKRVQQARERSYIRQGVANARVSSEKLENLCPLQPKSRAYLLAMMQKYGFSMRAYHNVVRVSQSIADLSGSDYIDHAHVVEAVGLRKTS